MVSSKALVVALVLAGCQLGENGASMPDAAEIGEALPSPVCGAGACVECAGCSVVHDLCFGGPYFAFGAGKCRTPAAVGTFEVTVGTATFTGVTMAGVVEGGQAEVLAHAADAQLALVVPATPGDYDCAGSGSIGAISYFAADGTRSVNAPTTPRPPCTIHVTTVGDVGGRIEGTFEATVKGPAELLLSGGTFSVQRFAYP